MSVLYAISARDRNKVEAVHSTKPGERLLTYRRTLKLERPTVAHEDPLIRPFHRQRLGEHGECTLSKSVGTSKWYARSTLDALYRHCSTPSFAIVADMAGRRQRTSQLETY